MVYRIGLSQTYFSKIIYLHFFASQSRLFLGRERIDTSSQALNHLSQIIQLTTIDKTFRLMVRCKQKLSYPCVQAKRILPTIPVPPKYQGS